MKKIIAFTLAALVITGGALYLVVVRPLISPAAETAAAEAALATPELVVLASLNVKEAAFLERWFLGAPVVPATHSADVRPPGQRTLFDHLAAAHVDARRDIDEVLYGLYPTDSSTAHQALVIVGRFDVAGVEQYLVRDLGGTPQPSGAHTYDVRRVNPTACDDVTTWTVTVDAHWILVTDPASHGVLASRLTQGAPADGGQLAWWRPLAHRDVLGIGLWRPRDLERTLTAPLLQASAHVVTIEAGALDHGYVGIGARAVPPSGRLRVVLDASDATGMRQKIDGWQQALRQSHAQWAATAPSLGSLFDSLRVTTEGDRETVEFVLDRTLASNAQRAVNELLAAMLAGLTGGHGATVAPEAQAERIERDPPTFVPVAGTSTLPPYDPAAMFAEDVDQIQGPFGVRLGAMRLGADPDVGLELVVEGFAGTIPNVVDPGGRVRLFVDGVKSSTGQELLRVESCGRQRNAEPADFTAPGGGRLRATKVVRLLPGVDPHTLQTVAGHIELRLPAHVETLTLAHPAPGATLASHGDTLTVTSIDGGVVRYQIAGRRERILHIAALNATGQPLASTSSFRSDFLFGDGVAGETHYAGRVDGVVAVFAVDEEAARWPFTLADLSMAGRPGPVSANPMPEFRPYGLQALRRDAPQANPFEVSFDRAQSMFATKLDFTVRSPALPNLEHAFTVGRLRLDRLELKDGAAFVRPTSAPATAALVRTAWDTALHFDSAPKNGMLTRSVYLLVDAKAAPDTIKAAAGVLTMQFPRTIRTLRLEELTPGSRATAGGMSVAVMARGRRSLTLRTAGGGDRVLYVRLSGPGGEPVTSFTPNITESSGGDWTFELSPQGVVAHADVIFAEDVERKDYPFRLELR